MQLHDINLIELPKVSAAYIPENAVGDAGEHPIMHGGPSLPSSLCLHLVLRQ